MDLGLTHLALPVRDLEASIDFWTRYAGMQVVHSRVDDPAHPVAWLSDLTRPFVIVLLRHDDVPPVSGWGHLGVACGSRDEVDGLVAAALEEGRIVQGPVEGGAVTGYYAIIADPDGHQLEVSFGQDVGLTVAGFGTRPAFTEEAGGAGGADA